MVEQHTSQGSVQVLRIYSLAFGPECRRSHERNGSLSGLPHGVLYSQK